MTFKSLLNSNNELPDGVTEDLGFLEAVVREAFFRKRRVLAEGIAARLRPCVHSAQSEEKVEESWIAIESMSQLRSRVGGRFTKLKERWLGAGLPVREHRGDRAQSAIVDEAGWLELSRWLYEQGFESRIASDLGDVLFEMRLRVRRPES